MGCTIHIEYMDPFYPVGLVVESEHGVVGPCLAYSEAVWEACSIDRGLDADAWSCSATT